jgi:hypothetical protein
MVHTVVSPRQGSPGISLMGGGHHVKERLLRAAFAVATLAALVLALGAPTRWG